MLESVAVDKHYIFKTPGMVGGQAHIAGKRLTVYMIAELYVHQNTSVARLMKGWPLTRSEIYAALAYYYDHVDEIEKILADWKREAQENHDPVREAELLAKAIARGDIPADDVNEEVTATEVAAEFGVAARVVRQSAAKGWIPARKSGATWLIRHRDAQARWGHRLKK